MKVIYVVMGEVDYEGSSVLRAFEDRGDADTYAKLCEDHQKRMPQCPPPEDHDAEWVKYERARKPFSPIPDDLKIKQWPKGHGKS